MASLNVSKMNKAGWLALDHDDGDDDTSRFLEQDGKSSITACSSVSTIPLFKSIVSQEPQAAVAGDDETGDMESRVQTPASFLSTPSSTSTSPPGMSFSLQSYLTYEKELERYMVGASRAQASDRRGDPAPPPATASDDSAVPSTSPMSERQLQMDGLDALDLLGLSTMAANGDTDADINDVLSLGSWPSPALAAPAVSLTSFSIRSSPRPNNGSAHLPVFTRHAALHRQLEEAGFVGLGDGSTTYE
ncbi:hypothetical protein E4U21_004506 [Claviceps maximensis]|nr:hypothetical protein E4U21_004506 [Claviceps maximensis]